MLREGTVIVRTNCHQPNHNSRGCPKKQKNVPTHEENHPGRDIPAPHSEGSSRSRKQAKKGRVPKAKPLAAKSIPAQEKTSQGETHQRKTRAKAAETTKKPTKKGVKGQGTNRKSVEIFDDESSNPISSVPEEWWNLEVIQKEVVTPSRLTRSKATSFNIVEEQRKDVARPVRLTRNRAASIVEEVVRLGQKGPSLKRGTPSKVKKSKDVSIASARRVSPRNQSVVTKKPSTSVPKTT